MNITRVIDQQRRVVFTTITGEVTLPEILADMSRLAANVHYSADMPGLVDMRDATYQLNADEIRALASTVKARPDVVGRTRRAILVGDEVSYGLLRVFQILAEGRTEYRVFRDEAEARAWIADAPPTPAQ